MLLSVTFSTSPSSTGRASSLLSVLDSRGERSSLMNIQAQAAKPNPVALRRVPINAPNQNQGKGRERPAGGVGLELVLSGLGVGGTGYLLPFTQLL